VTESARWQPASLAEAVEVLARPDPPVIVAGGTDLVVQSRSGSAPRPWCDIGRVAELRGIELHSDAAGAVSDGPSIRGAEIRIGALSTWSNLIAAPPVREHLPLLVEAALTVGAPAIRNRGTLGGNIVNASPAGDGLPVLLVHEAEVELARYGGSRRVPVTEYWRDYRCTVQRSDEILVAVYVPVDAGGDRPALETFRKVGPRRAQAIAKLSLAARFWRRPDGSLRGRLAMGAVAPVPLRCRETEALLGARPLDDATLAAASACLQSEIRPIDDLRSTAEYRRRVAGRLLAALLDHLLAGEV
jgi:xanthine dehydrogenase FAD-binding subunit